LKLVDFAPIRLHASLLRFADFSAKWLTSGLPRKEFNH
jgi:hypothetical protein